MEPELNKQILQHMESSSLSSSSLSSLSSSDDDPIHQTESYLQALNTIFSLRKPSQRPSQPFKSGVKNPESAAFGSNSLLTDEPPKHRFKAWPAAPEFNGLDQSIPLVTLMADPPIKKTLLPIPKQLIAQHLSRSLGPIQEAPNQEDADPNHRCLCGYGALLSPNLAWKQLGINPPPEIDIPFLCPECESNYTHHSSRCAQQKGIPWITPAMEGDHICQKCWSLLCPRDRKNYDNEFYSKWGREWEKGKIEVWPRDTKDYMKYFDDIMGTSERELGFPKTWAGRLGESVETLKGGDELVTEKDGCMFRRKPNGEVEEWRGARGT